MARDYKRENALRDAKKGKASATADRVARNKARQKAIKQGKARVGDGTDTLHPRTFKSGGSRSTSNTRVGSRSANRAEGGRVGGKGKGETKIMKVKPKSRAGALKRRNTAKADKSKRNAAAEKLGSRGRSSAWSVGLKSDIKTKPKAKPKAKPKLRKGGPLSGSGKKVSNPPKRGR